MTVLWAATISSPPRTKKNSREHVQVRGKTIPIPSAAFRHWQAHATIEVHPQYHPLTLRHAWLHESYWRMSKANRARTARPKALLADQTMMLQALVATETDTGDLVGYVQALQDFLVHRGVISDDKLIKAFIDVELAVDRHNPHIDVYLRSYTQRIDK